MHAQRLAPPKPQPAPVIEFFEVHELSISDLQSAMSSGRVTSRGLVEPTSRASRPTTRRGRA